MFYGRITDDFSMLTIDSTCPDNSESTLGTGTNDLENDTATYTNLYSGQVEEAFGKFGNSIYTGIIIANISAANCDHKFCVYDKLFSKCDTRESSVDDKINSICDTFLVENESISLGCINFKSISLDLVDFDHA